MKIKDSQVEWFRREEWSLVALRGAIGEQSLYKKKKKCRCFYTCCDMLRCAELLCG